MSMFEDYQRLADRPRAYLAVWTLQRQLGKEQVDQMQPRELTEAEAEAIHPDDLARLALTFPKGLQ